MEFRYFDKVGLDAERNEVKSFWIKVHLWFLIL